MRTSWDIVVIGAGPAGSLAARQAASEGASVLLVERSAFPRPKVCGCCLSGAALATLGSVGLGNLPRRLGGRPLRQLTWLAGGRRAEVRLQGGLCVSRSALDAALADAAQEAGATLVQQTAARVLRVEEDAVALAVGDARMRAGVAIVADGLGGRSLDALPAFSPRVVPTSRMGAGTLLADADLDAGEIRMACGRGGYVGLARVEDGRVDVAAALDASFVKRSGGPGPAAAAVLADAGADVPDGLTTSDWKGTPRLTRRRRVAGERVLVVGDAAGYVEPFTGEGMAWAMAAGVAAAPLAVAGSRAWDPAVAQAWTDEHARLIGRRQWLCRAVAWTLRRPRLAAAAAGLLGVVPALAAPATALLAHPLALPRPTPTGAA